MQINPLRLSGRRSQVGQAAVETALVLPLNLFLILAIIQMGLISQARVMAKYAAYRAVRVGAMNSANINKMQAAAQLALLPVIALPSGASLSGSEGYRKINSSSDLALVLGKVQLLDDLLGKVATGAQTVNVVICGPLQKDLTNVTQSKITGIGSSQQVDFDDPMVTQGNDNMNDFDNGYIPFMRTKLRIQVQFLYRMPIPFANMVIARAYLGMSLPETLRMSTPGDFLTDIPKKTGTQAKIAYLAMSRGAYIAPINVSYAMRMQSELLFNDSSDSGHANPFPTENDCYHYPSQGAANAE